MKLITRSDR